MLELGVLLFGTGFFGSSLAGAAIGGALGNLTYAGACQAFCSTRDRLKPSPQNHDLQKAFLKALGDGVKTVRNTIGISCRWLSVAKSSNGREQCYKP